MPIDSIFRPFILGPASFSDQQKTVDDLLTFAKLNEGRLYKLLKTCMDTQTDLKILVKSSVW